MISVTEVMFERIAFVFEHVVILVLDTFQRARPSRTTASTVASESSKLVTNEL
jgi:hypothetical protein